MDPAADGQIQPGTGDDQLERAAAALPKPTPTLDRHRRRRRDHGGSEPPLLSPDHRDAASACRSPHLLGADHSPSPDLERRRALPLLHLSRRLHLPSPPPWVPPSSREETGPPDLARDAKSGAAAAVPHQAASAQLFRTLSPPRAQPNALTPTPMPPHRRRPQLVGVVGTDPRPRGRRKAPPPPSSQPRGFRRSARAAARWRREEGGGGRRPCRPCPWSGTGAH
ncbi:Os04g0607300 [Oryza sativa Japonica Group]|uniref:Os04g0607300 protein n=1 Tax=Oryza sativa subsp. japonica TaxID=39947 RepID=A0A0P0WEI6_ORYSJ|nr:Os04g0607300 [Oryza sativa Japonica Group]